MKTHNWVVDPKRIVEYCEAYICKDCGAKGCYCDVNEQKKQLKSLKKNLFAKVKIIMIEQKDLNLIEQVAKLLYPMIDKIVFHDSIYDSMIANKEQICSVDMHNNYDFWFNRNDGFTCGFYTPTINNDLRRIENIIEIYYDKEKACEDYILILLSHEIGHCINFYHDYSGSIFNYIGAFNFALVKHEERAWQTAKRIFGTLYNLIKQNKNITDFITPNEEFEMIKDYCLKNYKKNEDKLETPKELLQNV